ncbi:hypothetical protein HN011_009753 [Eciton burchellii]|nr:hypothetical protein HN011_009753 [Eciton burchellii]
MLNRFILIWCLSYSHFETCAEHSSRRFHRGSSVDSQCTFDVSQNTYSATDLLRCMNELMQHLFAHINDQTIVRQASESARLTPEEASYESPYGDIIANLFNNEVSIHQNRPLDSTVINYQLNYLDAPVDQFGGLGVNLFDALSSISRHDDLRCVPRILCEVASGNPPGDGQSTGDERFGGLGDFGRNAFIQWLAGFDVTGTSPVLSFARATALGYGSRGDPATCYRAFPRCPRNSDKLVHYLNNHNGGFFRFFSRSGHGSYAEPPDVSRGNSGFVSGRRRKAPPPGIAGAEADRTGTGQLKFDIPVLIMRQDYGRSFLFPKENILESTERVVFPSHEEANDHSSENRIPKSQPDLRDSDANTSPPFFPGIIFL